MLIPDLTTPDPEAAGLLLARFGFVADAGLWRLGSQALRVTQGVAQGHGRIDHVALAVPDIDAALSGMIAKGLALADVTPAGPEFIAEFWGDGLRYVYLGGPDGARVELCQRVTGAVAEAGQDHVGIPCNDLSTMQDFFLAHGAKPMASVDLDRPEGVIPVRFLAFSGGVVELYRPATPERVSLGHWSRLLVPGLATPIEGPEGLTLAPV